MECLPQDQSLSLRLARIFYSIAAISILSLVLYYIFGRYFNLSQGDDPMLLTTCIGLLALATAFNLYSGIKNGVMCNMYTKTPRADINRTDNVTGFYFTYALYSLALFGELALIYYLGWQS